MLQMRDKKCAGTKMGKKVPAFKDTKKQYRKAGVTSVLQTKCCKG